MGGKKQFGVRLPEDSAEAVEEYVENRDVSQADALRRAIDEYFVEGEPGVSRHGSGGVRAALEQSVPVLAAVLLGAGIVLMVSGVGSGGGILATIGGTLLLIQHKLAAAADTALGALRELDNPRGVGALRYLYAAYVGDHPAPRNPSGVVERAAWLDLPGLVGYAIGSAGMVLLAVPVQLFGAEPVISSATPGVLFGYIFVMSAVLWVASILIIVASLAQITLGTSVGDAVVGAPTES
jgi:hypothetical protein